MLFFDTVLKGIQVAGKWNRWWMGCKKLIDKLAPLLARAKSVNGLWWLLAAILGSK